MDDIKKYIRTATFVFNYDKIDNIVTKFYINKHYSDLAKHYNEPTTIPVPEKSPDIPENFPIIKAVSTHKHSKLSVSPVSSSITANFDDTYPENHDLCYSYLNSKALPMLNLLTNILKNINNDDSAKKFNYCGLTCLIEIPLTESGEYRDSVKFLCNYLNLKIEKINEVVDSDYRIALLHEGFYINITFSHIVEEKADGSLGDPNLAVEIDINDRPNYIDTKLKDTYSFGLEEFNKMFDLLKKVVNSIDKIINKREVSF